MVFYHKFHTLVLTYVYNHGIILIDNSNSLSIDTKHHIQNIHIKNYAYKLQKTIKELQKINYQPHPKH
nr:MAG TPA: hypothetical protein [Caudoviricetes sp.]